MDSPLLSYLIYWEPLGYLLLFLGMMVEGDTVLFIAAFLAQQGILELVPMLVAALWGMILGDNLWYSLGKKLKNSDSVLNKWAEKLAGPLEEKLRTNTFRTIFLAKFAYGINRAVIFYAGRTRMDWRKVEQSDILATLLWMAIVAPLGYFSGASFTLVKHYLRFGEIALLIGLAIFWSVEYLILKKTKKRI